jgi:hypothetical protein
VTGFPFVCHCEYPARVTRVYKHRNQERLASNEATVFNRVDSVQRKTTDFQLKAAAILFCHCSHLELGPYGQTSYDGARITKANTTGSPWIIKSTLGALPKKNSKIRVRIPLLKGGMAHVTDTQFLCFLIAFFVAVCVWLAVSWLRIAGVLALHTNDVFDPEIPRNIVLEDVLKD